MYKFTFLTIFFLPSAWDQVVYLISTSEMNEALQHRCTQSIHDIDCQFLITLKEWRREHFREEFTLLMFKKKGFSNRGPRTLGGPLAVS